MLLRGSPLEKLSLPAFVLVLWFLFLVNGTRCWYAAVGGVPSSTLLWTRGGWTTKMEVCRGRFVEACYICGWGELLPSATCR